jgi:hypothetical protein
LALVQPNISFTNTDRGVLPDVTITENIQDILDKKDRQMEWVMKKIGNNKNGN